MEAGPGSGAGSLNAGTVEDIVRRGDADRYVSARAASGSDRRRLYSLYAFNLEVARAGWVASEPLAAAIRLQWWADAIKSIQNGLSPPRHDVAEELAEAVASAGLPCELLSDLVEARQVDIGGSGGEIEFDNYLDRTSGNLMWLAALALGSPESAESTIRRFAWSCGLAGYLRAWPMLAARNRLPFSPGAERIAALAARALDQVRAARSSRGSVPKRAAPAMLAGWRVSATLAAVARDPAAVMSGGLEESEFRRRGVLAWRSATGIW